MAKLLVINGPNLGLLGKREPGLYGTTRLDDIEATMNTLAKPMGHKLTFIQSDAEHELIAAVHDAAKQGVEFIIINPAAFTHTSVALRDALLAVAIPFIEVHLSNVAARESFRQHSYFSDIAVGTISGLGAQGYELALHAVDNQLKQQ